MVVVGGDGGARTGDQPSKGLKIVDIFGLAAPLETFACVAEMNLSVVVSERAPACG